MAQEKITYEQVQDGIRKINECSARMEEIFNSITGQMNNMTSGETFEGTASNALSSEFDEFKTSFPDYVQKVKDFATAYSVAKDKLEATEQEMAQKAQQLHNV